jgi:hypothetical protein
MTQEEDIAHLREENQELVHVSQIQEPMRVALAHIEKWEK